MTQVIDLTGQRFGRLTVEHRADPAKNTHHVCWTVRCICGSTKVIRSDHLREGRIQSCGCLALEATASMGMANRTHGHTVHRQESGEYGIWRSMLERCTNPKAISFKYYGARGVMVCDRWKSFENFFADMGQRPPGKSIDRMNNDGNYEPSNCRWATPLEQGRNRRKKGAA